jgi:hypothetical protein
VIGLWRECDNGIGAGGGREGDPGAPTYEAFVKAGYSTTPQYESSRKDRPRETDDGKAQTDTAQSCGQAMDREHTQSKPSVRLDARHTVHHTPRTTHHTTTTGSAVARVWTTLTTTNHGTKCTLIAL